MSELTLGNQNERPQDLDRLEMNLDAAIAQQVKDANANPSKFTGKGGDGFDMVTELGMSKASGGMTAAMQISAETSGPTAGTNSAFLMSGGGRKSKATKRLESLASTTSAMGLPKTYKQMKEDGRTMSRIMAGKGKLNKDPMSNGGDRGLKVGQGKKKPLSVQAVRNNPSLARSIGAGQLSDNLALTRKEKRDPNAASVVIGAMENKQQFVEKAKNLDAGVKAQAVKNLAGPKPPAYLLNKEKKD
ncbi:MAG: hypothetical protein GC185_12520 [Alphaproteobacteria bacterium]|nr:hypothetical protein [Alphaproteobacteria bacterium]